MRLKERLYALTSKLKNIRIDVNQIPVKAIVFVLRIGLLVFIGISIFQMLA